MWFRRAGELLNELADQRKETAVATALAATATAEVSVARAEAEAARSDAEAARSEADTAKSAAETAWAELAAARALTESMQSQIDSLSRQLEQRESDETAVRTCPQLQLPSTVAADEEAAAEAVGAGPTAAMTDAHGEGAASEAATGGEAEAESAHEAVASLVREALGGEVARLVEDLRTKAVATAEAACDSRVAVLETAVGELLGMLDAESHQMLLKWRRQADDAQREVRQLREQTRRDHVTHVDLQNDLRSERRRANEAEERARAATSPAVPAGAPPAATAVATVMSVPSAPHQRNAVPVQPAPAAWAWGAAGYWVGPGAHAGAPGHWVMSVQPGARRV